MTALRLTRTTITLLFLGFALPAAAHNYGPRVVHPGNGFFSFGFGAPIVHNYGYHHRKGFRQGYQRGYRPHAYQRPFVAPRYRAPRHFSGHFNGRYNRHGARHHRYFNRHRSYSAPGAFFYYRR